MVIVSDKKNRTDGSAYQMLNRVNTAIPIVIITKVDDFEFNDSLLELQKFVLVDMCEYGWDANNTDTHIFGSNTDKFIDKFKGEEWSKFDAFIKEKSPLIYFKRELFEKDISENIKPIEYPSWYSTSGVESKEIFDARALELFFSWGYSHEARRTLHGNIWLNAHKYGYMVCDNISQLSSFLQEESNPHKWVSVNIPHYSRLPMEDILQINGIAKLSVSLAGAGKKCFRHTESPLNSIMVMQEDHLKWTYPWIDGVNCFKIPEGKDEVSVIMEALKRDDLYEIYKRGVGNCSKYGVTRYVKEYLEHEINSI